MVAESAKAPSTLPAKRGRKPGFSPGSQIPLAIKLTVRSFYVVQGLGPAAIGPLVGLSAQQVTNMVAREGWRAQRGDKRTSKEGDAKKEIERLQSEHASEQNQRIHEAIAIRTEELSVKTLDHCAEILKAPSGSEKELQMASGAAMNFVKIARMSRGLDQRQSERNGAGDQLSVNLFVVRGETVESAVKRVEPVEVVATALPTT